MSDSKPVVIGEVPLSAFSGEGPKEALGDAKGQIFFSPAYDVAQSGNQIDIDNLDVKISTPDSYVSPQPTSNPRPMLFGPPPVGPPARIFPPNVVSPDYLPVSNDAGFVLLNTNPEVTGVMVETMSGNTTVILY